MSQSMVVKDDVSQVLLLQDAGLPFYIKVVLPYIDRC